MKNVTSLTVPQSSALMFPASVALAAEAERFFTEIIAAAKDFEPKTQDDLAKVGLILTAVKTEAKALEAAKARDAAPVKAIQEEIRNTFAGAEGAGKLAEKVWKDAYAAGDAALRAQTAKAILQVSIAAQTGDRAGVEEHFAAIQPPAKVVGASFREEWEFTVTDPKLIPREHLAIDMGSIRRAGANRLDGVPLPIPGGVWQKIRKVVAR